MDAPEKPRQHGDEAHKAISALTSFITESTLLELAAGFSETFRDLAKNSVEHFLVTPVTALPTGKEKGKFISIDVGGTNLRVGFIDLLGELEDDTSVSPQNGEDTPYQKIRRSYDRSWPIEDHLKTDKAEDLFAWIGDCIAEVINHALSDSSVNDTSKSAFGDELLLAITFSFPMAQTSLSEATLLGTGKGFAITADLNLGNMLLAAYAHHLIEPSTNGDHKPDEGNTLAKKRKLSKLPSIRIAAITNDTVATFASLAYAVKAAPNSRVAMGLIVGTGTNATIPMRIEDLHPSKREALVNPKEVETVVINTEWTIRGTDKPLIDMDIKTKWDLELDQSSERPGFQPFEYMTAGRYLGEIVRLVFSDLVAQEAGQAQLPPSLTIRNAVPTRFLSEVVARTDDDTLTQELNNRYAPISSSTAFWTSTRVSLLRDIAYAVQQRSSALIASACVGLLDCVGDIQLDRNARNGKVAQTDDKLEELVIAYAGGTVSQYPEWRSTCQFWIDTLVTNGSPANASKKVVLKEALDGGIIGAGVLAGMSDDIA